MRKDDVDFIKSMCLQGPDMTERQERRVRRIIDDMRMIPGEIAKLRAEIAEKDAKIARMFYWLHYNCTDENCAGDGENCPGLRKEKAQ